MRLDALIKWLLPREERFQELITIDTRNLLTGAKVFHKLATCKVLEDRRAELLRLKHIEHEGDQITRQVFEALSRSFITPFDREDIRSIAIDIDDILDYLEGIGQFLVLVEIADAPEPLVRFADLLVELCTEIEELSKLMWNMGNAPTIQDRMVRVSDLENQADAVYLTALGGLFRRDSGLDALGVMTWKEIYQGLEDACDKCKDFTHVLGNLLIKHA